MYCSRLQSIPSPPRASKRHTYESWLVWGIKDPSSPPPLYPFSHPDSFVSSPFDSRFSPRIENTIGVTIHNPSVSDDRLSHRCCVVAQACWIERSGLGVAGRKRESRQINTYISASNRPVGAHPSRQKHRDPKLVEIRPDSFFIRSIVSFPSTLATLDRFSPPLFYEGKTTSRENIRCIITPGRRLYIGSRCKVLPLGKVTDPVQQRERSGWINSKRPVTSEAATSIAPFFQTFGARVNDWRGKVSNERRGTSESGGRNCWKCSKVKGDR